MFFVHGIGVQTPIEVQKEHPSAHSPRLWHVKGRPGKVCQHGHGLTLAPTLPTSRWP